jgi:hypothetical protein
MLSISANIPVGMADRPLAVGGNEFGNIAWESAMGAWEPDAAQSCVERRSTIIRDGWVPCTPMMTKANQNGLARVRAAEAWQAELAGDARGSDHQHSGQHGIALVHSRMLPFTEFGSAPKDANGNLEASPYASHVNHVRPADVRAQCPHCGLWLVASDFFDQVCKTCGSTMGRVGTVGQCSDACDTSDDDSNKCDKRGCSRRNLQRKRQLRLLRMRAGLVPWGGVIERSGSKYSWLEVDERSFLFTLGENDVKENAIGKPAASPSIAPNGSLISRSGLPRNNNEPVVPNGLWSGQPREQQRSGSSQTVLIAEASTDVQSAHAEDSWVAPRTTRALLRRAFAPWAVFACDAITARNAWADACLCRTNNV